MIKSNDLQETPASILCKACGICCKGQLFIWAKLRPSELDPAEAMGMQIFRSDPNQRGFSQPCPLWQGTCTIYTSPNYPIVCRAYRCKLLKELLAEKKHLPEALNLIGQAQAMIRELEGLLPTSTNRNFRERLVAQIEHPQVDLGEVFRKKAEALLVFYEARFGVDDLIEKPYRR